MRVYEGGAGARAAYTVVLTQAPVGGNVFLNISPTELGDRRPGRRRTAARLPRRRRPRRVAIVLTFTAANWFIPQTVDVVAQDDSVAQGNEKQVDAPFVATEGQTTKSLPASPRCGSRTSPSTARGIT